MMPVIPVEFASDMERAGFVKVASFRRFTTVHEHIISHPNTRRYIVAYVYKGIWSAYPAQVKRLTPARCLLEYENTGEGPLVTTDDSLPLEDQLPRRNLSARSCNYVLYTESMH